MSLLTPRYLVPFTPRQLPHYFADVLIIGGGLAGLRAANAIDPSLNVLVVTKDAIQQSNSSYAQGGIAGVLDPDDRFEEHVQDTLVAGGTLCDQEVVEMVVREAPGRIQELIDWGTHFDEQSGRIVLGREGGHSHNRIVHALGDMTGKEVMRAVIAHTQRLPHVRIWENTFTLDLLTHEGACRGAIVATRHGEKMLVWARQTILATGGCGQIYRESTNPLVATGDGHAMAYRAGAQLRDMEFVQFHPTVLYIAGGSRSLITEAVRGEGGRLVDKEGFRFMPGYDPRAELAPRDIVSQAIVSQMEKTRHCVRLSRRDAPRRGVRAQAVPGYRRGVQAVRHRHYEGQNSGSPRRSLHDRRRHGRSRGPDDGARPVGGGRSQLQRFARGQSAGEQQPAGGAGVWCARRGRCIGGSEGHAGRLFASTRWPTRSSHRRPSRSTWKTFATRSRRQCGERAACAAVARPWPRRSMRSISGGGTCWPDNSTTSKAGSCKTCSRSPG